MECLRQYTNRSRISQQGTEENLKGLNQLNAEWVDQAMMRTRHQRIILDMDSSESPVYGEQEGAAYNGHFECGPSGEGSSPVLLQPVRGLRRGNAAAGQCPSFLRRTERWRETLEPIVERYQKRGMRLLFRADAAPLPSRRYTNTWSHGTSAMPSGFPPTRCCRSISVLR